jgi:putative DNA-invertase from lambdoid prophage Rac
MAKRTAIYIRSIGTSEELFSDLRQAVQDDGDIVVATFIDDAQIEGKGKHAAWNRLLTNLRSIDQVVLSDPGDLPGRTVRDLLAILTKLGGVAIVVPSMGIDTATGSAAVIGLVAAYRASKLSQAIRRGQQRAKASGKRIGRPPIPAGVKRRILTDLADGAGVRPTARKYNVSAASVVSLKQSMVVNADRMAA